VRCFFMANSLFGKKQSKEEYCRLLSTTQKTTYNSIGVVFCPILRKNVVFNAKGFHHLHYKPDGTPRDVPERIHKLTLVPLAAPVIRNALSVHEERDIEMPKSRKKGAKKVKGKQYALVAKVGRKNPVEVRVIILDIENTQNPIFWSIMKH
jgi:hypothetical protein